VIEFWWVIEHHDSLMICMCLRELRVCKQNSSHAHSTVNAHLWLYLLTDLSCKPGSSKLVWCLCPLSMCSSLALCHWCYKLEMQEYLTIQKSWYSLAHKCLGKYLCGTRANNQWLTLLVLWWLHQTSANLHLCSSIKNGHCNFMLSTVYCLFQIICRKIASSLATLRRW